MAFRVFVSVRGEEFNAQKAAAEAEEGGLLRGLMAQERASNEVGATFSAEGVTFSAAAEAAQAKAKAFLAGAGFAMEQTRGDVLAPAN